MDSNRSLSGRPARAATPPVSRKNQIDNSAAELFVRNGYDGTSMRDLARNLGVRPSSIYGHVKSKQELLFRVMERLMDEVLARANGAIQSGGSPQELVRKLIQSNISQSGPYETALLQSELKNLEPHHRALIGRKQKKYRDLWLRVLNDGVKSGAFNIKNPKLAFLGIDGALIHVERWFSPSGRLSRPQVADVFVDWVLKSLGFHETNTNRSGDVSNAKRTRLRRQTKST
ncbi:MAG TPA: TetR/AcrR family transcriptional regulator [Candidatus Binataceae bacterium]|nr:TetR/AcrR family transcriptional regulator [Candidatus Binataceae bacterium]